MWNSKWLRPRLLIRSQIIIQLFRNLTTVRQVEGEHLIQVSQYLEVQVHGLSGVSELLRSFHTVVKTSLQIYNFNLQKARSLAIILRQSCCTKSARCLFTCLEGIIVMLGQRMKHLLMRTRIIFRTTYWESSRCCLVDIMEEMQGYVSCTIIFRYSTTRY